MASAEDIEFTLTSAPREKTVRVLLIGETGSGKTSFIDLLHNYARLDGKEFEIEDIENLTPRTAGDPDEPNITTECTPYTFQLQDAQFHIIDTPGLSSCREKASSEDKIKNFIVQQPYINCVCILINGRLTRLQNFTKISLLSIACILPRKANIILLFTNTANSRHQIFRLEVLNNLLGFSLKDDHIYHIDNPCSLIDEEDTHSIKVNFTKTFDILKKFFTKINSFDQVNKESFFNFIDQQEEIERKLAELRILEESKSTLEKKIDALSKNLGGDNLSFSQSDIIPSKHYSTICEKTGCHSNCHNPCFFTGMIFKQVKNCKCIKDNGSCSECGHHYSEHRHRRYLYATRNAVLRMDFDDTLRAAKSIEQKNQLLLDMYRQNLVELGFEKKSLTLKKELLILFAKFQNLGHIPYHKVLALESETYPILTQEAQEAQERLHRNISNIDNIPYSNDLDGKMLRYWACLILNLDPTIELDTDKITKAYRDVSRYFQCYIKKSGQDILLQHMNRAKDILLKFLN